MTRKIFVQKKKKKKKECEQKLCFPKSNAMVKAGLALHRPEILKDILGLSYLSI